MIYSYHSGDYYIGSSCDIYKRKKRHISHLNNNKHCNIYLQRLYNKHGIDKLKFIIIEEINNTKELKLLEQLYIDTLKPKININKNSTGGDMILNHPFKEEIRKRQIEGTRAISNSKIMKKKRSENAKILYPLGPMHNKKHSQKTKENMRKSRGENIIINNVLYNSYREAEEILKIDRKKLKNLYNSNQLVLGI